MLVWESLREVLVVPSRDLLCEADAHRLRQRSLCISELGCVGSLCCHSQSGLTYSSNRSKAITYGIHSKMWMEGCC